MLTTPATEALIHAVVALPAPALLGFAAWRAHGGTRMTLAIMAVLLFAVFFIASYGLFCLGCN
jgi:CHASE2 domain-containing sensor protein